MRSGTAPEPLSSELENELERMADELRDGGRSPFAGASEDVESWLRRLPLSPSEVASARTSLLRAENRVAP